MQQINTRQEPSVVEDMHKPAMDGQAHAIFAHVEHPADALQVLSCDTFAAFTRQSRQHDRCMEHMHGSTRTGMMWLGAKQCKAGGECKAREAVR